MPLREGKDLVILVETEPNIFTAVADLTGYSNARTRAVTRVPVFNRTLPRIRRGAREESYSLTGLLNDDDPGQVALREAESTDQAIRIAIEQDGVEQFRQTVEVVSYTHDADPEGFQEITIELVPTSAAILAGAHAEFTNEFTFEFN